LYSPLPLVSSTICVNLAFYSNLGTNNMVSADDLVRPIELPTSDSVVPSPTWRMIITGSPTSRQSSIDVPDFTLCDKWPSTQIYIPFIYFYHCKYAIARVRTKISLSWVEPSIENNITTRFPSKICSTGWSPVNTKICVVVSPFHVQPTILY
jgi:hypothetical protein